MCGEEQFLSFKLHFNENSCIFPYKMCFPVITKCTLILMVFSVGLPDIHVTHLSDKRISGSTALCCQTNGGATGQAEVFGGQCGTRETLAHIRAG